MILGLYAANQLVGVLINALKAANGITDEQLAERKAKATAVHNLIQGTTESEDTADGQTG